MLELPGCFHIVPHIFLSPSFYVQSRLLGFQCAGAVCLPRVCPMITNKPMDT